MNIRVQAVKNLGSSWLGVVLTFMVGLFLSPFILHKLGDDAFGLWVLIFSITGYYGICDFGIRSSVVKYVAQFEAVGDRNRLTRIVNVSIFVYSCVATGLLCLLCISTFYLNVLFRIAPSFLHTAKVLFLMVGAAVAVGFPLSVFTGILEGLQKFYFVNVVQAATTLLRVLLIVIALNHGCGLLTVAFITVFLPLVSYLIYAWRVMCLTDLQFGLRYVDGATFRLMYHYSSLSFMSIVAFRLRFQTDAIIIGAMVSSSAITYFSVGSKLVSYSLLFITGVGEMLTPMFSQLHATNDQRRLRKLVVIGNRACAFIVLPISATLLVLGKGIIDVWVGPRYEASYVIMAILVIPSMLCYVQGGSRQMLYGIGEHKALAVVSLCEGVVNIILSVVLIHIWGIVGDAIGTAIPLAITSTLFLPQYVCRSLGMSLIEFVTEAYLLPLRLTAPLVAALMLMQHIGRARTYPQLGLQLAVGALVYGVSALSVIRWQPIGGGLRTRVREYVFEAFTR